MARAKSYDTETTNVYEKQQNANGKINQINDEMVGKNEN